MPSGYLTSLKDDVILDEGVLMINSTTAFGVTDGPISYDNGETWQNLDFAGKRCDVALLDRLIGRNPRLSFDLIQVNTTTSPVLVTGSTQTGTPVVVTPHAASSLLASGDYETNVKVWFKHGNGKFFGIWFPMAMVRMTGITGRDKNSATIRVEIDARLDLSASTDTDASPVKFVVNADAIS